VRPDAPDEEPLDYAPAVPPDRDEVRVDGAGQLEQRRRDVAFDARGVPRVAERRCLPSRSHSSLKLLRTSSLVLLLAALLALAGAGSLRISK
jgi:hypothetical protein